MFWYFLSDCLFWYKNAGVTTGKAIRICKGVFPVPEAGPLDPKYSKLSRWGQGINQTVQRKIYWDKTGPPGVPKIIEDLKTGGYSYFRFCIQDEQECRGRISALYGIVGNGHQPEFINEPHINTDYYKKMQAETVAIAKSGRESVDNLIQSVLTAITEFQKTETKEKIRVAFEQAEK